MIIKTNKLLTSYKYLIMFDLASRKTGICVWDIADQKPLTTYSINTSESDEIQVLALYTMLDSLFNDIKARGIDLSTVVVAKEAMPVQVHGGKSTVQTFIALARSHAILDLYTKLHNLDVYDYVGVYPSTTHNYLHRLLGVERNVKLQKSDTLNYIQSVYGLHEISEDEADAVFLAQTLVNVKWNNDIHDAIQGIKKHIKQLKSKKSIDSHKQEIKRLEGLLLPSEDK